MTGKHHSAHVLSRAVATQIGADLFKPGDRVFRKGAAGTFLGYGRAWAYDGFDGGEPVAWRAARVQWDGRKHVDDTREDSELASEAVTIFSKRFPRLKAKHYPPLVPGRDCAGGAAWWPEG